MSMDAKELHGIAAALLMQSQADEDGVMVTVSREACDKAARALSTHASLLAAVESSGDELVREAIARLSGFADGANYSPWIGLPMTPQDDAKVIVAHVAAQDARITLDAQEKAALKGELDFHKFESQQRLEDAMQFKAELASVKAHAEAMADAIQFGDMAILTVAKAAAEAYRAAHPKEGA